MKTWKKISVFIMIALSAMAPLFAEAGEWGSDMNGTENPFSVLFRFLQTILISAATGALVGCRFIINIVKAYYSSDEGGGGSYKKEIIKFVITVMIVMFGGAIIGFVTGWI